MDKESEMEIPNHAWIIASQSEATIAILYCFQKPENQHDSTTCLKFMIAWLEQGELGLR